MMKRTKEPSQKLNLQRIIKKTLEDRPGMTTGEFIRTLESKGVNVLFNQATTCFVSGISYDYEGFPIKGVKLGNYFKWTSIKNNINYEQERDRTAIHEANLRTKANSIHTGIGSSNDRGDRTITQAISKRAEGMHPILEGKGFDLEALLNSHSHRNLIQVDHQPDLDPESALRLKRKKKRRGRRL